MAELLLRARSDAGHLDLEVGSAGLLFDGRPAERGAVKAMERRGLDLGPFTSQKIGVELLSSATLVLAMEARHVREASILDGELFGRTFTLPGFVARATAHGARRGDDLAAWVAAVGADDDPADYLRTDPSAEVADPMGLSTRAFRACADELDDLISRLVHLAWPVPTPAHGTVAVGPAPTGGTHADRDRR